MSGGSGLTKTGGGTLALTAAQGYGGPTVVSGGVLKLQLPGVSTQWTTGGNYSIAPASIAGAVPLANWNVVTVPAANTLGTLNTVLDSNGATAGSLSFSFSSSAKDPVDNTGYATTIQQLMNSGLTSHTGDSGGNYGTNRIAIANIPYSSYDLYVYVSNWSGDPQLTDYLKINQNASGYTAGTSVPFKTFADGSQTGYTTYQPGQVSSGGTTQLTDLRFAGMSASSVQLDWYPGNSIHLDGVQIVDTAGGVLPLGTPLAVAAGATLDLGGATQQFASLSDVTPGSGGTITNSNASQPATITVSTTGSATFSGSIQDGNNSIGLAMNGSGVQALAGSNAYSGGTTISSGTLQLGDGAVHNGSVAGNITDNATLAFANPNAQTFGGVVSGSGAVKMSGPGALTLGAANFYSGGTTVNGGTLQLGNASALGTGGLTANNGTVDLAGNNISVPSFSGAAGTITNNGGSGAQLTVSQSGTTTFGGTLADGAGQTSLSMTGTGTLVLANANTFSGTVHVGNSSDIGQIVVAHPLALQNATATDGNDNGIVFGSGITAATLGGLRGTELLTLTNAGGNGVNLSVGNNGANTVFSGTLGGSGGLTKIGSGMLTLSGVNTYGGGTTVSAGTLQLAVAGALPGGTVAAVNGTLDLGSFNASTDTLSGAGTVGNLTGSGGNTLTIGSNGGSSTFSGVIQDPAGPLALYKTGNGTFTLTGSSTYAGGTTMNNGMLVVADGPNTSTAFSALGSGILTLNGGTLAAGPAGGSVGGLVQAGSAAHSIAPGAALSSGFGTLNLNGGLTTNANTTLAFNVYNAPQVSGVYVGDLINLNGSSLTVSGGSIAFVAASPTALGDYRLIANLGTGSTNATDFSLPAVPGGSNDIYTLSTSVDPGNLDLVVASAATFSGSATWIATGGSAVWSNSANWADNSSGRPGVPGISLSRTADTATFNGTDSAPTITLDVSPSLAALSFSGTNYTLSGSGTLTLNGTAGATITVAGGTQSIASAVRIAGGNLVVAASGSGLLALSGSVSDDGLAGGRSLTLTGDGSGQLVLGGVNSYTGGTCVEQGTLIANTNGAIPDQSGLIVGAGGTFIFDPTVTGAALANSSPAGAVAAVPEPGTIALLLAALWSAAIYCRRNRK